MAMAHGGTTQTRYLNERIRGSNAITSHGGQGFFFAVWRWRAGVLPQIGAVEVAHGEMAAPKLINLLLEPAALKAAALHSNLKGVLDSR